MPYAESKRWDALLVARVHLGTPLRFERDIARALHPWLSLLHWAQVGLEWISGVTHSSGRSLELMGRYVGQRGGFVGFGHGVHVELCLLIAHPVRTSARMAHTLDTKCHSMISILPSIQQWRVLYPGTLSGILLVSLPLAVWRRGMLPGVRSV